MLEAGCGLSPMRGKYDACKGFPFLSSTDTRTVISLFSSTCVKCQTRDESGIRQQKVEICKSRTLKTECCLNPSDAAVQTFIHVVAPLSKRVIFRVYIYYINIYFTVRKVTILKHPNELLSVLFCSNEIKITLENDRHLSF